MDKIGPPLVLPGSSRDTPMKGAINIVVMT